MDMKKGPSNPTAGYLTKGHGGKGTSSIVKGGQSGEWMLKGGVKENNRTVVGGKRYSLRGDRKM